MSPRVTRYDEAPELAPDASMEVHHPPSVPEVAAYGHPPGQFPGSLPAPPSPVKPAESTNPSTLNAGYGPSENLSSPYAYDAQPAYGSGFPSDPEKSPRQIWGCSILVFILSVIIAILSAAVIGLAAGTGVEASRANDAEAKLASMSGSATTVTVAAPASTSSDYSSVDKGCSTNSASVTGTTYASQFYNRQIFTIYCNSDTPNSPISSLFVGDFDDCMDACASYSFYVPSDFSNVTTSNNATCAGVSFIPFWTNRTNAFTGGAPGNCYLKPGPQNQTALTTPNIGQAVHAALLKTD